MHDPLNEAIRLINQELTSQSYFFSPSEEIKDNELCLGKLTKPEIAVLSALKRMENKNWQTKMKMISQKHDYNHQLTLFNQTVINILEKLLITSFLFRFKEQIKDFSSYTVKKDWQVVALRR